MPIPVGPILAAIDGGAVALSRIAEIIAQAQAEGDLTDEEIEAVKARREISDAEFDARLEAAKARLAGEQ